MRSEYIKQCYCNLSLKDFCPTKIFHAVANKPPDVDHFFYFQKINIFYGAFTIYQTSTKSFGGHYVI